MNAIKENKHLKPSAIIRKANQAIRIAVAKAIADHKRLGFPIYVMEGSRIVKIPPHRLPSR